MSAPKDIIVRPMRDDEINTVAELAARSFREAFEATNKPSDIDHYLRTSLTVEKLTAEFDSSDSIFLIACSAGDDTPNGYAKLNTATANENVRYDDIIEIERLYADPAAIGFGVGAALMRACIETGTTRGCQAIWLGVWERNPRAIRFYERWKFKTVGSHHFSLGDDLQTDLLMVRELNGPG